MITKKMHMMAKPIASAAGMRGILRGAETGCVRKTAAFVTKMIDQYTKRLNGAFDPVSLIFLEQMADGSGFAGADGATVIITCRLLSYLIQNTGQAGMFQDHHSFLVQQLTGQVERNLEILKDTAADAGRELSSCYLEYQKIIEMGHAADDAQQRDTARSNSLNRHTRMEQIFDLQERMHRFEQVQMKNHPPELAQERIKELSEPERQHSRKPLENRMPVVMTHAFFANLNHWARENRLADHREIWKQANERQMVQQKLKDHMQRFLQEEDFIKQEEQLSDIIWQYGRGAVFTYLEQADLKVYEKLLPVLHTLSGMPQAAYAGNNSPDDRAAENKSAGQTDRNGNRREYKNGSQTDRNVGDRREHRRIDNRDPAATAGRMLEEYQAAAVQLEHFLTESDEQTKVLLQETAAEYKKYFMQYVQAVSGIQKLSAVQETAGRQEPQIFPGRPQAFEGRSQGHADMQVQTEEDQEVFSDAEIELLLQKKEGQTDSAKLEAAELKLKLLTYREIAEQLQQEGSAALHQETLQKIAKLLDQESFLYNWRLEEYQKADVKLSEMISNSDDVTKNMLLEKAEEYQNLFYTYISAAQTKQEAVSAGERLWAEQKTASAGERLRTEQKTASAGERLRTEQKTASTGMGVVPSGEYEMLFSDRELAFLLRSNETDRMTDFAAGEQKAAEYKLDLLAYREAARQVLQEFVEKKADEEHQQSEVRQERNMHVTVLQKEALQKETLKKMIQLFDQVCGVILQQENLQKNTQVFSGSSRQMHEEKESVRDRTDVRSILEHGSLPERKLLFLAAEKNVDELLIQMQEAGDGGQWNRMAHAPEQQRPEQRRTEDEKAAAYRNQKTEHIRYLVRLKNQLQQIGGQAYHGTDDWGFLLTNEAGGKLLRIMQQEEHPLKDAWKQKVQQSLTDFYNYIKKDEFHVQASESSSFLAEWNPVFRQEEWQQLRSLARNQQPEKIQKEKKQKENAFWQELKSVSVDKNSKRELEHVPTGQNSKREPEHVPTGQSSKREPEHVPMGQNSKWEPEHVSTGQSSKRESEHMSMGQSINRNLESVSMDQSMDRELESVLTGRAEKMRQAAVAGFGYLQMTGFSDSIKLLQKDIWKKAPDRAQPPEQDQAFMRPPEQNQAFMRPPEQDQAFMRPPEQDQAFMRLQQDAQNRQAMKAAAALMEQHTKDTAARHIPGEQAAIVHTQRHTKDTAHIRRITEEKEQQQKQELQRLEADLLDYRSELRTKAAQLDQVEKKLAAQEKERKLVRDSRQTFQKQGKTVAERRQMFHQLKEELQLEYMRSGLV